MHPHRPSAAGSVDARVEFKYDVFGNRTEKTVDADGDGGGSATTTKFAYDENGNAWVDYTGSSTVVARHIFGDGVDDLHAWLDDSGSEKWYLRDLIGSVRDLVNASGSLIDHLDYNSFGKKTYESASGADRYLWTSREYDAEIDLQYNRARYYDANTGRWISMDPLGFDAGDSNLYRYVNNHPTTATDPSGEEEIGGYWLNPRNYNVLQLPYYLLYKKWALDHEGMKIDERQAALDNKRQPDLFKKAADPLGQPLKNAGNGHQLINPMFDNDKARAADQGAFLAEGGILLSTTVVGVAVGPSRFTFNATTRTWTNATAGRAATAAEAASAEKAIIFQGGKVGTLRSIGQDAWVSAAGLKYVGHDPDGLNRVQHVLRHTTDVMKKGKFGVFGGGRQQVLGLIDEAWGLRLGPRVITERAGNRTIYVIPMNRNIGYVGGQAGANLGNPQAPYLRLVVENGNEVISAYPFIP